MDLRARLADHGGKRSEEHTSELQSQSNLVCRLLLEKKKIENQVMAAGRPVFVRCMLRSKELFLVPIIGADFSLRHVFFFLMIRGPPKSTLFPYTPLFR